MWVGNEFLLRPYAIFAMVAAVVVPLFAMPTSGSSHHIACIAKDPPFVAGHTDITDHPIPFFPQGEEFIETWSGKTEETETTSAEKHAMIHQDLLPMINPTTPINIWNARVRPHNISFHENGFSLIRMDRPSKTKDWRSDEDIKHFQYELRPKLQRLFPTATRFEFSAQVVRNGPGDTLGPVGFPHVDFFQDDKVRANFHKRYPTREVVQRALLGLSDTRSEEMRVLLGVWKPIDMKTPVGDFPLAVMDARTFDTEHQTKTVDHNFHEYGVYHNIRGGVSYDKNQRWYYFPNQTVDEVLIFTHYTKDRFFCNPHMSFRNPSFPAHFDSRISVELRVAVYFSKDPLGCTTCFLSF